MTFRALIEQDEGGVFVAQVPVARVHLAGQDSRRDAREHPRGDRGLSREPREARRAGAVGDSGRAGRGCWVSKMPSGALPVVSGREVVRALRKVGCDHRRGSHMVLRQAAAYRRVAVPYHKEMAKRHPRRSGGTGLPRG